MTFTPELVFQIIVAIAPSFGVYAAIRADIARAIVLAEQAGSAADKAHHRIDEILSTK